jgi:hypothetical protein
MVSRFTMTSIILGHTTNGGMSMLASRLFSVEVRQHNCGCVIFELRTCRIFLYKNRLLKIVCKCLPVRFSLANQLIFKVKLNHTDSPHWYPIRTKRHWGHMGKVPLRCLRQHRSEEKKIKWSPSALRIDNRCTSTIQSQEHSKTNYERTRKPAATVVLFASQD